MTTIIPLKIQADGKEVVVDVFADDTVNAVQEKVSAGFKQSHLPYIYANGSIGMTHRFLDSTASYDPKDWDKSSDKEPKVSSLGDVLISDWLYDTGIKKSQQLYAIFNSKWPILHPKVSSKNSDAQTNILTALQKPSSVESLSLEYYRVHYEFKVPTRSYSWHLFGGSYLCLHSCPLLGFVMDMVHLVQNIGYGRPINLTAQGY